MIPEIAQKCFVLAFNKNIIHLYVLFELECGIPDSLNYYISETSQEMKFNFRMRLDVHRVKKFTHFFQVGVVRHA